MHLWINGIWIYIRTDMFILDVKGIISCESPWKIYFPQNLDPLHSAAGRNGQSPRDEGNFLQSIIRFVEHCGIRQCLDSYVCNLSLFSTHPVMQCGMPRVCPTKDITYSSCACTCLICHRIQDGLLYICIQLSSGKGSRFTLLPIQV